MIKERIKRGVVEILRAKEKGKDTSAWEDHLISLIDELPSNTVKVKIGQFGFCSCLISRGLCTGCWRIIKSCECIQLEVDPEKEMTSQYHARFKNTH